MKFTEIVNTYFPKRAIRITVEQTESYMGTNCRGLDEMKPEQIKWLDSHKIIHIWKTASEVNIIYHASATYTEKVWGQSPIPKRERESKQMTTFKINYGFKRVYANNGQHQEQAIRFTLTGEIVKADNLPHDLGADVLNYQVKSARATVCKGTDIEAYLDREASTAYIYATEDGIAYIMSREEYTEFVKTFGTVTRDSSRNGGGEKIRLKHETETMRGWLKERA